jgi:hypothetical protein
VTKLIVSFAFAASLLACGGKSKSSATPDNATGTTQTQNTTQGTTDGTGGTTYGGATYGVPAAAGQ